MKNHTGVSAQPMNAPTMHVCELNKIILHPGMRLALYNIQQASKRMSD
jgi:hypothetical protein